MKIPENTVFFMNENGEVSFLDKDYNVISKETGDVELVRERKTDEKLEEISPEIYRKIKLREFSHLPLLNFGFMDKLKTTGNWLRGKEDTSLKKWGKERGAALDRAKEKRKAEDNLGKAYTDKIGAWGARRIGSLGGKKAGLATGATLAGAAALAGTVGSYKLGKNSGKAESLDQINDLTNKNDSLTQSNATLQAKNEGLQKDSDALGRVKSVLDKYKPNQELQEAINGTQATDPNATTANFDAPVTLEEKPELKLEAKPESPVDQGSAKVGSPKPIETKEENKPAPTQPAGNTPSQPEPTKQEDKPGIISKTASWVGKHPILTGVGVLGTYKYIKDKNKEEDFSTRLNFAIKNFSDPLPETVSAQDVTQVPTEGQEVPVVEADKPDSNPGVVDTVKGAIKTGADATVEATKKVGTAIADAAKVAKDKTVEVAGKAKDVVVEAGNKTAEAAKDAGKATVNHVKDLKDNFNKLTTAQKAEVLATPALAGAVAGYVLSPKSGGSKKRNRYYDFSQPYLIKIK